MVGMRIVKKRQEKMEEKVSVDGWQVAVIGFI